MQRFDASNEKSHQADHQQIIIIQKITKMHKTKIINKHFPSHIVSVRGSQANQFMLKAQGENWIQIHNTDYFVDVISLPQSLRMARLNCCNGTSATLSGKHQYCFDWGNTVAIGSPNQFGTETHIECAYIQNSIFMTNAVSVAPGRYGILSLNSGNNSKINIFQSSSNSKLKHYSIQNSHNPAPLSNLVSDPTNLYFVSSSPEENLISFDLQRQYSSVCLQLPEVDIENKLQCFLVPKFDQQQKEKSQLACIYGSQWLGLADLRFNGLVALQRIYDCQSAFGIFHQGRPKIYYSQGNLLRQYDIRKACSKRNPVLTFDSSILQCGGINKNLLRFQDVQSQGIHIYNINSFQ